MELNSEQLKRIAAEKAVSFVKNGMLVGLGTGSTTKYAVEELGRKMQEKEIAITGTPTSLATKELALSLGIPLIDLDEIKDGDIDIVIDGADQIDLKTGLCIKGGGGAHFWEKKVAKKAKEVIIIVDESKIVTDFVDVNIPLEIEKDKKEEVVSSFENLGLVLEFREKMSDSGNLVADTVYDGLYDLLEFEWQLLQVDGVLDTGIFKNLVSKVIVAKLDGTTDVFDIK